MTIKTLLKIRIDESISIPTIKWGRDGSANQNFWTQVCLNTLKNICNVQQIQTIQDKCCSKWGLHSYMCNYCKDNSSENYMHAILAEDT